MQATYQVGRIAAKQVDPAYLLVRPVAPHIDADGWRAFCGDVLQRRQHHADQDDIIVASNPLGYVQGLCIGAVRGHLAYGRILDVSVFVVTSAADEAGVALDLLRHLKAISRAEGCGGIRIWSSGTDTWSRYLDDREVRRSSHVVLTIADEDSSIEA